MYDGGVERQLRKQVGEVDRGEAGRERDQPDPLGEMQ